MSGDEFGKMFGDFDVLNPPAGLVAEMDQVEAKYDQLLVELMSCHEMATVALGCQDEEAMIKWVLTARQKVAANLEDGSEVLRFIAFLTVKIRILLDYVDEIEDAKSDVIPDFIDGMGQKLFGVHTASVCKGPWCVIHRPCPGPWDNWLVQWREDTWKGFERVCQHGYPHPAVEEAFFGNIIAHSCDGCPCSVHNCEPVYGDDNTIVGYEVKK